MEEVINSFFGFIGLVAIVIALAFGGVVGGIVYLCMR